MIYLVFGIVILVTFLAGFVTASILIGGVREDLEREVMFWKSLAGHTS
jgi:hypothetical protein